MNFHPYLSIGKIRRVLSYFVVLVLLSASVIPSSFAIDDSANAKLLAFRAKSLVHKKVKSYEERKRHRHQRMGSPHAAISNEAGCGGVAIGNVRPALGDHRQHNTTVIINGSIINANNGC
jgi:hypothetical protein